MTASYYGSYKAVIKIEVNGCIFLASIQHHDQTRHILQSDIFHVTVCLSTRYQIIPLTDLSSNCQRELYLSYMPFISFSYTDLKQVLNIGVWRFIIFDWSYYVVVLKAMFMGPTWGPSGTDRTQMGPMLAPWTLVSGLATGLTVKQYAMCTEVWWSGRCFRYQNMLKPSHHWPFVRGISWLALCEGNPHVTGGLHVPSQRVKWSAVNLFVVDPWTVLNKLSSCCQRCESPEWLCEANTMNIRTTQIISPDNISPASVMFNTELILFPQILNFPSTSLFAWRVFFVEVLSKINRTFPI